MPNLILSSPETNPQPLAPWRPAAERAKDFTVQGFQLLGEVRAYQTQVAIHEQGRDARADTPSRLAGIAIYQELFTTRIKVSNFPGQRMLGYPGRSDIRTDYPGRRWRRLVDSRLGIPHEMRGIYADGYKSRAAELDIPDTPEEAGRLLAHAPRRIASLVLVGATISDEGTVEWSEPEDLQAALWPSNGVVLTEYGLLAPVAPVPSETHRGRLGLPPMTQKKDQASPSIEPWYQIRAAARPPLPSEVDVINTCVDTAIQSEIALSLRLPLPGQLFLP